MQHSYLMQCAWMALLIPIGGLVYMIRHFILSSELPWIAAFMIWLLLFSYLMFGIIPTALYLSYEREWIQKMPWFLDILNLVSKFPIPILILIAFSTRPAGFRTCSG